MSRLATWVFRNSIYFVKLIYDSLGLRARGLGCKLKSQQFKITEFVPATGVFRPASKVRVRQQLPPPPIAQKLPSNESLRDLPCHWESVITILYIFGRRARDVPYGWIPPRKIGGVSRVKAVISNDLLYYYITDYH